MRGYGEVTQIVSIHNPLATNKKRTLLTSTLRNSPTDTFITPCASKNKHHLTIWRTTERMADTIAASTPRAPASSCSSSSGSFSSSSYHMTGRLFFKTNPCSNRSVYPSGGNGSACSLVLYELPLRSSTQTRTA